MKGPMAPLYSSLQFLYRGKTWRGSSFHLRITSCLLILSFVPRSPFPHPSQDLSKYVSFPSLFPNKQNSTYVSFSTEIRKAVWWVLVSKLSFAYSSITCIQSNPIRSCRIPALLYIYLSHGILRRAILNEVILSWLSLSPSLSLPGLKTHSKSPSPKHIGRTHTYAFHAHLVRQKRICTTISWVEEVYDRYT